MERIIVIDGRTFKIDSHTARLAGVDAPGAGEFLANETTEHFKKLTVDKNIKLSVISVIDGEAIVQMWADELFVNKAMNEFLKENGNNRQIGHAKRRLRRLE